MTTLAHDKKKPSAAKYEGVPRVNRAKDFLERVGWTFIEVEVGLGALDWISNGINLSLWHTFYASLGAAAAATAKVLWAQRVGKRGSGDAIPGGVIERGR
jgi:hypothetical protein